MQKLSLIITPKSTFNATSLTSVISKEHIESIARQEGALIRQRKFSLSSYLINAVKNMCAPVKKSEFTLCSMHESYNRLHPDNTLSHKCIHKQLQSDESLNTVKILLSEALSLYQSKAFYRELKKSLPEDLDKLLTELKVKDIILIDGTEIDLSYSCADNFSCKGKGRLRLDGKPPRPGLKLHVAFSVIKHTFEYIEITEAVGSERDCVHPERFNNCLIIADRGYVNEELEKRIADSGNLFLIRGKSNTAGSITKAVSDEFAEIKEFKGLKVNQLPLDANADLQVESARGHSIRVIVRHHKHNDDSCSIIRTNIPGDRLCAKQIYLLYRLRWTIELFNKANKQSSCLQSINSADKNIILIFLLLSVLVSVIKTYCGHKARFENNLKWLSMLKLHKRNAVFKRLYEALLSKGLSTVYQIFKELLDDIALNAKRSMPSNRDRVELKDLPLLIWEIVNHPRPDRKIA